MNAAVPKVLVTVGEAAQMLSLSERKLYELVAGGYFTKRYVGTGRRNYRLEVEEVRQYAANLPTSPPAP